MISATVRRTLMALPKPVSQSTSTGMSTARQMRRVFSTSSLRVSSPASGSPRRWALVNAPETPTMLKPAFCASWAWCAVPTAMDCRASPAASSLRSVALVLVMASPLGGR